METFEPGDRVVAINTDHSGPICGPSNPAAHPFRFPDGRLCEGPIYHVATVGLTRLGTQTLWITGLRVFWGNLEMPWDATRFRKVDALKDFTKARRSRKIPIAFSLTNEWNAVRCKPDEKV